MRVKALFAFSAIVLAACASNDLPLITIHGSLNREVTVKERQAVIFDVPDDEVKIEVISIKDSRCPINALCIWEGFVLVTFKISSVAETVDLVAPPTPAQMSTFTDTYSFTMSGNTYRLELKGVTPLPSQDNREDTKSAIVELERI